MLTLMNTGSVWKSEFMVVSHLSPKELELSRAGITYGPGDELENPPASLTALLAVRLSLRRFGRR